ncbi:MAG TPA: TonB-dependent receptor [Xanthomonadales bacterium]|nr:TonB-dependent receptor [Xanthomonadales bacterium]
MRAIETSVVGRVVRAALYGTTIAATAHAQAAPASSVASRIPATASTSRVVVLTHAELERTGLTSLGDILQELAVGGAAVNTQFNGGGNGETQASLRNLGANRTLVLVDGKRWIQGLRGAANVDSIPLAIVDRVEILLEGASALYGADAVAGVVNVVTRRGIQGAEASAYLGENAEGDGRTEQYDLAIGSSSDRASVDLVASYTKQETIFAGDREISSTPLFGLPGNSVSVGSSSTTPFGRFGFGSTGGRLPNGAPGTLVLVPGRPGTAPDDFRPYVPATDGYNFVPENYLLTPQERTGVFARGRYAITQDIAFATEVSYGERRSQQGLAGFPFVFGTAGSGLNRFTIPANALYNPFGIDVTRAQFRNAIVPRRFDQDVDTFRFVAGFDGSFALAGRAFAWDVGYVYSDEEQRNSNTGFFDVNRLALGLGPSFRDGNGVPRCGTPAAIVVGCVPLNIFGGPDGFTREMADYAGFVEQDNLYRKSYDYTANVAGDLFALPAGALRFAAGYAYRREYGFDQPDALTTSGASSVNFRAATRGGYSLDEFFAELTVPVLKDVAFAEVLDVSLAARRSDYSTFGETTSPKLGFSWRPVSGFGVHGSWSEDFRAPSIAELFTGSSYDFPILFDPCSASQQPQGEVLARCRNGFGGVLPVPIGYEQVNGQIRTTRGGNPELAPETSRTKTLGVAWAPSWAEGLDVQLDWFNVRVEDLIAPRDIQAIMDDCYRVGSVDACAFITRQASGDVLDAFTGAQNLPGFVATEGFDLAVDYRFETSVGLFALDWRSTYLSYFERTPEPSELVRVFDAGARGNAAGVHFDRLDFYPRIRSNLATSWRRGDWSASVVARYVSGTDERCDTPVAFGQPGLCSDPDVEDPQFRGGPVNHLDDTWYFDLQGSWDAPWQARITAGIRNAFDEDPPVSYSTTDGSFDPSYDVPGRFWYVRYEQRF